MTQPVNGDDVVKERARELAAALSAAPAIGRYRAAQERFRGDAALGEMQAGLQAAYERLQAAERELRHDPGLFQEVRSLQARLQRHPVVVEFGSARSAAQDLLRQVNAVMTEALGVDIGASVGRSGGCC